MAKSKNKSYTVGKVKVDLSRYTGEDTYSDGDIENEILAAVRKGRGDELLHSDTRWPVLYHLSVERQNLVSWLPLTKSDRVLEIGSGCGAVTGALCRLAGEVHAVEISPRRSEINAHRNQRCGNLTIHVGNLHDMDFGEKFDYVTVIGVLEYAGTFTRAEGDPYAAFLRECRQFLKPGGTLIVAIENRLGMKYWSGAAEDHTGRRFDGILNYAGVDGIRTFSRLELHNLLASAGMATQRWYYAYPDYKLPFDLHTDEYPPTREDLLAILNASYDTERLELFPEAEALASVIPAGLYDEFANSFLVLCRASDTPPFGERFPAYVHYSQNRALPYKTATMILNRGGQKIVRKFAAVPEARKHIRTIAKNIAIMSREYGAEHVAQLTAVAEDDAWLETEYVEGITFLQLLLDSLRETGARGFSETLQFFADNILRGESGTAVEREFDVNSPKRRFNLDLALDNIKVADGNYVIFDSEWLVPIAPWKFMFWRLVLVLWKHHETELQQHGITIEALLRSIHVEGQVEQFSRSETMFSKTVQDCVMQRYTRRRLTLQN